MQNPINPEPTFILITTILMLLTEVIGSTLLMATLAVLCFVMVHISYKKIEESNQRDSTVISKITELLGYRIHKCGCVYKRDYSRHSTNIPESEWVEQEKVYERSMKGAKVRFQKKQSGMKRCTQCGNHYHTTESMSSRNSHTRICWPEEEPDVREELDHRVVEA